MCGEGEDIVDLGGVEEEVEAGEGGGGGGYGDVEGYFEGWGGGIGLLGEGSVEV